MFGTVQAAFPPVSVGPAIQLCAPVPVPSVSVSARPAIAVVPSSSRRAESVTGLPCAITVGPVYLTVVSSLVTLNVLASALAW